MDTSFKAVVFDANFRVLLGTNPRSEWELLGGRADLVDLDPSETISRELQEEAGLEVAVGPLIDIWYYDIVGEGRVAVASYLGVLLGDPEVSASDEHGELAFHSVDELDALDLPEGYKTTIRRAYDLVRSSKRQRTEWHIRSN